MMKKFVKQDIQQLFRNMLIHIPIIKMIKFDIQVADKVESKLSTQLLQCCYRLLALFTFANSSNQTLLEEHLDLFLFHLSQKQQSISYLVIKELYRNRANIFIDQNKLLKKILENLFIGLVSLDNNNPLKTLYFDTLKVFIKQNHQIIKQN